MGAPSFAVAADARIPLQRVGIGRALPVLVAMLVVGLGPMLLLNFVGLQSTRDRLVDLSVANLTARSASTAAAIDDYIQSRRRDIILVSQLPDVIAYAQNLTDPGQ